jgi:hypothetical protein
VDFRVLDDLRPVDRLDGERPPCKPAPGGVIAPSRAEHASVAASLPGLVFGLSFLPVLNPLRSEQEAFRFLLYVAAIVGVIVGIVLLLRAIF